MSAAPKLPRDDRGHNVRLADAPGDEGDASFDPEALDAAPPAAGPDPFDVDALRLPTDFAAATGVQKLLLTVPVRKPNKAEFVRVHPDPRYRITVATLVYKGDGRDEVYLIAPGLRDELVTEPTFKLQLLATAVNRQGVLFLWPANLPRQDGRADEWSRSALEAIEIATRSWVRVVANLSLGAYEVSRAASALDDPEWPAESFSAVLKIAFRDRLIDATDHPVLRRLRGEV